MHVAVRMSFILAEYGLVTTQIKMLNQSNEDKLKEDQ